MLVVGKDALTSRLSAALKESRVFEKFAVSRQECFKLSSNSDLFGGKMPIFQSLNYQVKKSLAPLNLPDDFLI